MPLEDLLLPPRSAPPSPARGPFEGSPLSSSSPPGAHGTSAVRLAMLAGAVAVVAAAGWLAFGRGREAPPSGSASKARAATVPPKAPEPVRAAPAPAPIPAAAPAPAPTAPAATSVSRPRPPADEPLFAGRPLAWWNERLRLLAAQQGDEARRLEAVTLRRAQGLGLSTRADAGGVILEAPARAPEAR